MFIQVTKIDHRTNEAVDGVFLANMDKVEFIEFTGIFTRLYFSEYDSIVIKETPIEIIKLMEVMK